MGVPSKGGPLTAGNHAAPPFPIRPDPAQPRHRLSAVELAAWIRAALWADPWWADLGSQLPAPVISAMSGTPNWRVAGWRGCHPLPTEDHFRAIHRAIERVQDLADWSGE